jgi:hypothetical protein
MVPATSLSVRLNISDRALRRTGGNIGVMFSLGPWNCFGSGVIL